MVSLRVLPVELVLGILCLVLGHVAGGMLPYDLEVDYMASPALGVENPTPGFSWKLADEGNRAVQQSGYHLQIHRLDLHSGLDAAVVWDSGVVKSSQNTHVRFATTGAQAAERLKSGSTYRWRVKYWTSSGEESAWAHALFHTAFLKARSSGRYDTLAAVRSNFNGSWIGSTAIRMNQLRKEFTVPSEVSSAFVYATGIGYFELSLNGQAADPSRKLDPGWTTYQKTVLYSTFNVSSLVKPGTNAIGIMLGSGWYSTEQYIEPSHPQPTYGPPRVLLQLNINLKNGQTMQVYTDPSWMGREGPIVHDSVYNGETYDARKERPGWNVAGFTDHLSLWINAEKMPAPGGVLRSQTMEPIRVLQTIKPVSVQSACLNTWVFDMGQNFAGWARLKLNGTRGVQVRIRYAEILELPPHTNTIYSNMVYTDNLRGAAATDTYVMKGAADGEWYEPRFTVHGFRYVQVSGAPQTLTLGDLLGVQVGSAVATAGAFNTSNPVLRQIHKNIVWGQQSNLMSLPSDCPQRDERKGWMGDAGLTVDECMYNFKAHAFYSNFLQNIEDAAGPNGEIPDTVPWSFGSMPGDPSWGSAFPKIMWNAYKHYGDVDLVKQHYVAVRAWVDYLTSRAAKGLQQMYSYYGDWVPPPPASRCSGAITSSHAYLHDVSIVAQAAAVVGNSSDVAKYTALYNNLTKQFHAAFYNASIKGYGQGRQTANALALSLKGVTPPDLKAGVVQSLVDSIKAHGNHLTTGILGTEALFPALSSNGQHDLALEVATGTTYPSFGYMFTNPYENATTLWELWDAPMQGPGMNSRNHIMFGSIDVWLYTSLGGIEVDRNTVRVAPKVPKTPAMRKKVDFASASHDSMQGTVVVEWSVHQLSSGHIQLKTAIHVPPNMEALFVCPPLAEDGHYERVTESGQVVWRLGPGDGVPGVELVADDASSPQFRLSSGDFRLLATWL